MEHVDENTPSTSDVLGVGLVDKLAELSVHGNEQLLIVLVRHRTNMLKLSLQNC